MRVLLIRLSSLGDVVLATAAVEALAEDRPDVEIHVLTKPAFREVFRNHPAVARCLEWDPSEGLGRLAEAVRRGGYDRVVDLHGNLRTRALRALAPTMRWSRYRKGSVRRRVAVWLRKPALLDRAHVVDRYVRALAPLGVRPVRRLPRVFPAEADYGRVEALLRASGWAGQPLIALAPAARWATKAWPEAHWIDLVSRIRGEDRGFPVVIGGAGDRDLAERILAGGPGANLAGETSIPETAAVLERCEVLVTNDSAPLHLATAVGTRVVALFGPTVTGFGFYPLGPLDRVLERPEPCRPCSLHGGERCRLGTLSCLEGVSPETVCEDLALGEGAP